jgi:uncharacterized protein YggE
MKYLLSTLGVLICFALVAQTTISETRFIEVSGSAEMEIVPDEIVYQIDIEEYWEEEFEEGTEYKDYKTKVPLEQIEDGLIKNLRKVGIREKDITVRNLGNYWRPRGKEFLFSKQFEVKINELSKINELAQIVDSKGVKRMNVAKLDHSNMEQFRKQVKINALKAARDKAQYLVESIGHELGEVISISEVETGFSRPPVYSNVRTMSSEMAPESINQIQNITLSYQVQAKFRIN